MPSNCSAGARRSNQSILKEINPEYFLEGLVLKLKLQYSGHLMWTDDSLEKSLMLGKIEGRRRRGHQRMRWLDGITDAMELGQTLGDSEGQGGLSCCSPWGGKELDTTGQLKNTIMSDAEHLFMCFWPSVCLWRKVCLDPLPIFWLVCLFFWCCTAWD